MGKETEVRCKCDLCGKSKSVPSGMPEGWVEISIETQIDRDWDDKVICSSCVEKIEEQTARRW